jgi:hypothetical protein
VIDLLRRLRGSGESYSDVIVRLATNLTPSWLSDRPFSVHALRGALSEAQD